MSFVTLAPEYVEAAAHDLAAIGSSLSEATSAAAAPTTALAPAGADEVSAAIAAMFGDHAQSYQALAARASAFHEQFVSLMNSGAGAYLSTEIANAEQTLQTATAPAQSLGGVQAELATLAGGAPGLINGFDSFGATVAGPYQTLYTATGANLQSLASAISANPAPLLHQIISNQAGYAQTIGTGFQGALQNFPAELAGLPANIQAIQAFSPANAAAVLQGLVNNQIGYAQTISTSLQNAAHDFTTGLQGLPGGFQAAAQQLAAGNVAGAVGTLQSSFADTLLTGFNVTVGADNILSISPTGTLGDLLPILSIPGQMAQNFTGLLPAGSIPAQVSQHFTNLINLVTDTSTTSSLTFLPSPDFGIDIDNTMGLPLVLGIEALGAPANALNALGSSATAFVTAAQTGDAVGATAAVLDAPAVVANGFLNGQSTLPLTITALGLPTTLNIPLDGLLVPPSSYTATIPGLDGIPLFVTGTPISGLLPGLLTYLPADLAAALGGPAAPVIPFP